MTSYVSLLSQKIATLLAGAEDSARLDMIKKRIRTTLTKERVTLSQTNKISMP